MFTSTVSINPAFLQEIKEDHQELWQLVAEAELACLAPHPPPRRLAELLNRLRDRLGMHFALEEAFGYFDDPVSVAPRLCQRADQLRAQHSELFLQTCRIVEAVEQLQYHEHSLPLARLTADFREFHKALMEHEAQENMLILQAFDDDLGVGD
jgi:hypothetical protein